MKAIRMTSVIAALCASCAPGDDSDIRDFHSLVLDAGPQPLAIPRQRTDRWITAAAAGARPGN